MDITQRWNHEADGSEAQRTIEFEADHEDTTLFARVVLPYSPNSPMDVVVLSAHMRLRTFVNEFLEDLKTKDPDDLED